MKTLLKQGQKFDFYVKREYSLFQFASFTPCYINVPKSLVGIQTVARYEAKNNWGDVYLLKKDMDAVTNHYAELIEKGTSFLDEEIKTLDKTGKDWVSKTEEITKASQIKGANLQELLKDFWDLLNKHAFSLWKTFIIPEASNIVFTKLLTKYVSPELHPEVVAIYSRPSKKAHLLRLSDVLSKESNLEKRVEYIKEHYPWIFTTDLFSPLPIDEQYVEYAKTFKKPEHKEFSSKELFPKKVMSIIRTYQDILYLKDHRDEYRRRAFYGIQPLIERIIERYKITREDLWHIFPKELNRFETDRNSILKDIAERKIGFIFETDGKNTLSFQGKEAVENFIKEEEISSSKEIKGIVGAPGKAVGKARIVKKSKDLKTFKEGNILVAVTTNPDYISAMQKASAFITDEGGITSHAAIVARELRKPCIIGTKIATKVLKDGDLVEVDAEKGIVKIIK